MHYIIIIIIVCIEIIQAVLCTLYLQCIQTIDWIRSEGHTGVIRYYSQHACITYTVYVLSFSFVIFRHLQADGWKIVSAADDKTLKVWFSSLHYDYAFPKV